MKPSRGSVPGRSRKSPPVDEMREYSRQIKLLKGDMTHAEFAAKLDVSPMAITHWLKGTNEPTPQAYMRLAGQAGGTEMEPYFQGQASLRAGLPVEAKPQMQRSMMTLRVLSTSAAAGVGWINDSEHDEGTISLPAGLVPVTASTVAITLRGDSMEPTIKHGTLVLVDTARRRTATEHLGKIVVAWNDVVGVVIKRLVRREKELRLASDNPGYAPFIFDKTWTISGEVRWWVQEAP